MVFLCGLVFIIAASLKNCCSLRFCIPETVWHTQMKRLYIENTILGRQLYVVIR